MFGLGPQHKALKTGYSYTILSGMYRLVLLRPLREEQQIQLNSLDEYPPYVRLTRIQRYSYIASVAPFLILIVIVVRYFPDTRSRIVDALILLSLAWAVDRKSVV